MNKREKQQYDSEVILVWTIIIGVSLVVIRLFYTLIVDLIHYFKH